MGSTLETVVGLQDLRARCVARTVAVAGKSWRVRDTGGSGVALILLPGSLGNADIFYRQVLGLVPRLRCIAVDYPDASADVLADGLAGLLDGLDLGRACLLGSSLAGYWLTLPTGGHYPYVTQAKAYNQFVESVVTRG